MITSGADEVKKRLFRLLEIEKYMPVMTPGELRDVTEGKYDFDAETVERWDALLDKRNKGLTTAFLRLIKDRRSYADKTKPSHNKTFLRGVADFESKQNHTRQTDIHQQIRNKPLEHEYAGERARTRHVPSGLAGKSRE